MGGTDDADNATDDTGSDDSADETETEPEGEETEEEDEAEDSEPSGLVGTFDDFEDLDQWEAFQGIGSIEAEEGTAVEGSQSALLEADDDGQVRARRALDEPIDIRDVVPGVAMTADDRQTVLLQLQDEDGDYVEFSQRVMPDMPLTHHNFGLSRVRGDPDLENIVVLQIISWLGDDGGQLWVDDFNFVPNTDTGKVMVQFHGGYESHHDEALEVLSEYDIPATAFVPTDRLRSDIAVQGDRMTYDQVADLADAGWTIGSQSALGTPLTGLQGSELESSVTDPIDWLTDQGYDDGAQYLAFPGMEYDEEAYELVQENYELAFAGQSPSQGYARNPHLCSVFSPDAGEAVDILEWTAEYGGISSIAFFNIEEEETVSALEEMAAELDGLLESEELELITPEELASEYVYEPESDD